MPTNAIAARGWLLPLLLTALVLAGCSGGKSSAPPSRTSSPTGAVAGPSGDRGGGPVPLEIAPVLKVAAEARDVTAFLSLATLRPTLCGPAASPDTLTVQCPDGIRPGTLVPFFRLSACEAAVETIPRDRALQILMGLPRQLVAVVRGSLNLRPDSWAGDGDYAIVVRAGGVAEGEGIAFLVRADKFWAVVAGCGRTPEQLLQNVSPEQLLTLP